MVLLWNLKYILSLCNDDRIYWKINDNNQRWNDNERLIMSIEKDNTFLYTCYFILKVYFYHNMRSQFLHSVFARRWIFYFLFPSLCRLQFWYHAVFYKKKWWIVSYIIFILDNWIHGVSMCLMIIFCNFLRTDYCAKDTVIFV